MSMSDNKTIKLIFAISNELRIRHLNFCTAAWDGLAIDISACLKGQPAIDHQPAPIMTIEVEVHTDFTCPAQWQEPKIFRVRRHCILII
jgi:hypothetical protein